MQNSNTPEGAAMRQLWLDAAVTRLAEGGVEAVKIMPLAKMVGQTRTGFYWYFKDREALLHALLELWESRTTGPLIAQAQIDADSICDAVLHVMDCWVKPDLFDARLDQSVRRWALQDGLPRAKLDRSDKLRQAALAGLFDRFGYGEAEAEARATLFLLALSGQVTAPRAQRTPEAIAPLVELLSGMKPTPSELRRFLARHAEDG